MSCGAALPMLDSWVSSWAPGFGAGGTGATGSADAVVLSISAVETAPAAAIMVETNSFRVRYMVLPIVGRRRPVAEVIPLLMGLK